MRWRGGVYKGEYENDDALRDYLAEKRYEPGSIPVDAKGKPILSAEEKRELFMKLFGRCFEKPIQKTIGFFITVFDDSIAPHFYCTFYKKSHAVDWKMFDYSFGVGIDEGDGKDMEFMYRSWYYIIKDKEAQKYYEKKIKTDPSFVDFYSRIGKCFSEKNNTCINSFFAQKTGEAIGPRYEDDQNLSDYIMTESIDLGSSPVRSAEEKRELFIKLFARCFEKPIKQSIGFSLDAIDGTFVTVFDDPGKPHFFCSFIKGKKTKQWVLEGFSLFVDNAHL
jgi:hypothetical protein